MTKLNLRTTQERMGFYTKGAIQREVPRILRGFLDVQFSPERIAELKASDNEIERRAGELAERSNREGRRFSPHLRKWSGREPA